jgi:hypothetical protein
MRIIHIHDQIDTFLSIGFALGKSRRQQAAAGVDDTQKKIQKN